MVRNNGITERLGLQDGQGYSREMFPGRVRDSFARHVVRNGRQKVTACERLPFPLQKGSCDVFRSDQAGIEGLSDFAYGGTLVIGGTGAMDDFASAADAPWDPAAVARVTVADDVTLGKNALAALSDTIRVSANESIGSMRSALGTSTGSSGAISGAEFDQVQIIDGKAYLGVSVYVKPPA